MEEAPDFSLTISKQSIMFLTTNEIQANSANATKWFINLQANRYNENNIFFTCYSIGERGKTEKLNFPITFYVTLRHSSTPYAQ